MLNEILFFTYGDSYNASLWSNVPYLFAKTLEKKGIILHRVNLKSSEFVTSFLNKSVFKILNFFFKDSVYDFSRSRLEKYLVNRRINKSVKKFPKSDYCFFLMFGYYNKFTNIPSLLFGDWTFEHLIKVRKKRNPNCLEQLMINQENEAIRNAEMVVPMFYDAHQSIIQSNPQCKTAFRKLNVVNVLNDNINISDELIKNKIHSNIILFIGRKKYIEGANLLIKTFGNLYRNNHNLELHIIGLNAYDFNSLPQNVYCHGFLHKDKEIENKIYYDLLSRAKVIVNPSKEWAGYSSMIEAMFFYTPVVVTPYYDFVNDFGNSIKFGAFCTGFNVHCLQSTIEYVIYSDNYQELALIAHQTVKDCTWENYIDWLESIVDLKD